MAILSATGAALGSFLGGNTRAAQAHTSLDKTDAFTEASFDLKFVHQLILRPALWYL